MNIIQQLIPASNKDTRPGIRMVPKYITIHETDNPSPGADAEAHARLQQRGNDRSASWHLQIDDSEAIQSIPFNEVAWAAGDGRNGKGNSSSIHIEICVNSDGDFRQAVENAAEVTKQLMSTYKIPLANVVQHNRWSGKNCPRNLRNGAKGVTWSDFLNLVKSGKAEAVQAIQARPVQIGPIEPVFVHSNTIIQRVRALVQTDIRSAPSHSAGFVRDTRPGEEFNVFAREGDWHNVGGANWIDGNGGKNLYWIDNPASPSQDALKSAPYPGHLIRRGSKGEEVKMIQRTLGVSQVGSFGPKTEAAVKAFQKRNGLAADGIVGQKTWDVMFD
ncbi:N-acetylmuramoyl-L-alanine amidase [Bacillus sp. USDA818B3_A]|uniref:N-acetylmuramoyl-L-alanine amidase n=1 Tax=Bacillus sp. USDA818B3_A TaxID=2698834 RepID=UPI001370305E|nr:N-acetylmuramoyl-L-alanine amidase [Bacillus sp. USDA818B3_A]